MSARAKVAISVHGGGRRTKVRGLTALAGEVLTVSGSDDFNGDTLGDNGYVQYGARVCRVESGDRPWSREEMDDYGDNQGGAESTTGGVATHLY